jgi:DNA-binding FadR family transcriptional regulator
VFANAPTSSVNRLRPSDADFRLLEHVALAAIRAGKRKAARDAMRAHLTQVLAVMTGDSPAPERSKVASRRRTR